MNKPSLGAKAGTFLKKALKDQQEKRAVYKEAYKKAELKELKKKARSDARQKYSKKKKASAIRDYNPPPLWK